MKLVQLRRCNQRSVLGPLPSDHNDGEHDIQGDGGAGMTTSTPADMFNSLGGAVATAGYLAQDGQSGAELRQPEKVEFWSIKAVGAEYLRLTYTLDRSGGGMEHSTLAPGAKDPGPVRRPENSAAKFRVRWKISNEDPRRSPKLRVASSYIGGVFEEQREQLPLE